jgi:addiction module RelE/StbE family toxin
VKLIWTTPALKNLSEAHDYIEIDNPGAAKRMATRIESAVNRLRMFPQIGRPSQRPKTRELVIAGTPFIAVYTVQEEQVFILAILHGARNWKEEL